MPPASATRTLSKFSTSTPCPAVSPTSSSNCSRARRWPSGCNAGRSRWRRLWPSPARLAGAPGRAPSRRGAPGLGPDNVFLCTPEEESAGPNVKVLDFGISKIRGSQTVATQDAVLMGTPQYMAPEQALGKNTSIDARTDVFALGAIVYEMLGGAPAFGGSSLAEVVYKVVHAQPQPLAQLRQGLPLKVLSAVDRALQKDPAHRPKDVSAFVAELTGRPLTVPAASPQAAVLDATLASPARPIPLLPETDATFTPATPVPLPRETSPMATPPERPWATPPPVSPPSAWPAPFHGQTAPRAELVTAPEARPTLPQPPKSRRHVVRWVVAVFVVLAFFSVLRRNAHKVDVAAALRAAEALSKKTSTGPEPPVPPVPPVAGAQGDTDNAAQTAAEFKKGLEQVKKTLREALNSESDGQDAAKAGLEAARQAKQMAEEAKAANTPKGRVRLPRCARCFPRPPKTRWRTTEGGTPARGPKLLHPENQRRLGHQGPGPLPAQGLGQRQGRLLRTSPGRRRGHGWCPTTRSKG